MKVTNLQECSNEPGTLTWYRSTVLPDRTIPELIYFSLLQRLPLSRLSSLWAQSCKGSPAQQAAIERLLLLGLPPITVSSLFPRSSPAPPPVPSSKLTEHRSFSCVADTVCTTHIPTLAHFSPSLLVCEARRTTVNRKCLQYVRYWVGISIHMIYSSQ